MDQNIPLKVKKLTEDAQLPHKGSELAAGNMTTIPFPL